MITPRPRQPRAPQAQPAGGRRDESIDSQRLETFPSAAQEPSSSEAARRIHPTHATISHHIKNLTSDLGVELFDRASARHRLTDAGRSILPWACRLVADSKELQDIAASPHSGVAGERRIACSSSAGKYILPG